MTELSIIIVNYNTKDLVLQCIDSIKRSGIKASYEIIVIDNASRDGSRIALKKLKNIIFIQSQSNLGFSKANNLGIKKAKGNHILLLNSDTVVHKKSVDALLKFAKSNSNVGLVGSRLLNKNGTTQGSVYEEPGLIQAIKHYWFKKGRPGKYAPGGKNPVEVDVVVAAAMLITPQAIEKVGGLNEKYFMYFEDIDYCRRVRRAGFKVYYLPESEITHLHGRSGKNLKKDAEHWRRLIPSSKIYHGLLKYYAIQFVIKVSQKVLN